MDRGSDASVGVVAVSPVGQLGPVEEFVGVQLLVLVGSLILLVIGAVVVFVAAKIADERVQWLAERMELGDAVLETPLGVVFEAADEVQLVFGRLARYFVYVVGLLALVALSGQRALIAPVETAARYVPSLLGALLIVVVGFVVAGYVGRSIKSSEYPGGPRVANLVAPGVQLTIYFVVLTLALDALGYSTAILNTLAQAVAIGVGLGVGLGIALAIGIAVGMGSQEYVAEHVEDWLGE